jgi:hypothetical protein
VALAEMFADRRVVMTDGIASGTLTFVAAVPATGQPPGDRALTAWADDRQLPWVEVIDNEVAYWGGLTAGQVDRLLAWFCCQRPVDQDWRAVRVAAPVAARLRAGLFEHGWTRNLALVREGKKPTVDLWGGVHGSCILDHRHLPLPSQVHTGVRLALVGEEWTAKDLGDRCSLSDDTGKLPLGR